MSEENSTESRDKQIAEALKRTASQQAPDPELWQRIQAGSAQARVPAPAVRRWPWPIAMGAFAMAALLLLMVGVSPWIGRDQPVIEQSISSAALLADALTEEFETYVASGRDLDIRSSEPDVLAAWFGQRMDALPPVPPIVESLPLLGGRLCDIQRRRTVAYMYAVGEVTVSLYVTPYVPMRESDKTLTSDHLAAASDVIAHESWLNNGWRYSIVGKLPEEDIAQVAKRLAVAL